MVTAADDAGRLDLDAVEARATAASEGPWTADSWEIYGNGYDDESHRIWVAESCDINADDGGSANATFIAAARTDVPELVAELRAAREDMARVRKVHRGFMPGDASCQECCGRLPCPTIAALDGTS